MKKILMSALTVLVFCCQSVLADEVKDVQKVKVDNSYLTSVRLDKETAQVQEVVITKSFLVRVYIKACNCNTAVQLKQ